MPNKMFHSGHTLVLARRSYDRLVVGQEPESQICIILSAVALEGFVNDLEHFAELAGKIDSSEQGEGLGRVLGEAERQKASLLLKIDLAHLVMTGRLPDKGAQPYQDIQLLITLRNLLVHSKPEEVEWAQPGEEKEYPKIVRNFVARGVIFAPTKSTIGWYEYVVVPRVAAWAYNTVVRAWRWFAAVAPEEGFLKIILNQRSHDLEEIPALPVSDVPAS